MALRVNVLNVSLAGGMNEKTPRELLPVGQNSLVLNGRWRQPGMVETRLGYTSLATTVRVPVDTTIPPSFYDRLLTRDDELCRLNEKGIYSYSPEVSGWFYRDRIPELNLYNDRKVSSYANACLQFADMAVLANGMYCVAWEDGTNNTVHAAVYGANGQLLVRSQLQTNAIRPRVVAMGTTFIIVWVSSTVANTLYASNFDGATPGAFLAPTAIVTDLSGTGNYTWDLASTSTYFIVAYQDNTNALRTRKFDITMVSTASISLVGSNVLETGVYLDGTDVYVAYHNTIAPNTSLIKYDSTLSVAAWTVTAIAGANGTFLTVGAHDNEDYVWVVRSGASGFEWRAFHKSSGIADTAFRSIRNVTPASKIFAKPGTAGSAGSLGESYICVRVAVDENEQEGLVRCGLGTGGESTDYRLRPVAKWLTGKVFRGAAVNNLLPQVATGPDTVFYAAFTEKDTGVAARGAHVCVTRLDAGADNRWARLEDRHTALVAGAMLHQYDGDQLTEVPFAWYPFCGTPAVQAGGSLTVGKVFQYVVCYEWTDARGRVHRSKPSLILTPIATSAGNQTVRIIIPHLTITSRSDLGSSFRSKLAIAVYRRNSTDDPNGPFVRLAKTGGGAFPTLDDNDPLATASLVFSDTGANYTQTDQPQLYTTGGVLPAAPPSSCRVLTRWDSRIWIGGCENARSVWYSRELVEDEPPLFHENQQVLCEEDVTALASFDSALIVFSANAIWVMQGHGPNDLGQGSSYTGLIKLPSEVGCQDWRSVCVTEEGVFFQHRPSEGIYLLGRSLSLSYVGAPIETETTSLAPTITSTVAVPSEDEIRFSATNGSTGRLIVYNNLIKQWMVHTPFLSTDPRDAIMWQGAYVFCKDTLVAQQSEAYRDYNTAAGTESRIALQVTTGDISIDGPLGVDRQWRILFFGRRSTSSSQGLEISVAYDQTDTFTDVKTWTAAEIAALTSPTHMVLEAVAKTRQEARSIRLRVTTIAGNTAPIMESAGFMNLALEFGKEEGVARVPAAQKR